MKNFPGILIFLKIHIVIVHVDMNFPIDNDIVEDWDELNKSPIRIYEKEKSPIFEYYCVPEPQYERNNTDICCSCQ